MEESGNLSVEEILASSRDYSNLVVSADIPALPLPPHIFFKPIDVSMPDTAPEEQRESFHSGNWLPQATLSSCNHINPSFQELLEKNRKKQTTSSTNKPETRNVIRSTVITRTQAPLREKTCNAEPLSIKKSIPSSIPGPQPPSIITKSSNKPNNQLGGVNPRSIFQQDTIKESTHQENKAKSITAKEKTKQTSNKVIPAAIPFNQQKTTDNIPIDKLNDKISKTNKIPELSKEDDLQQENNSSPCETEDVLMYKNDSPDFAPRSNTEILPDKVIQAKTIKKMTKEEKSQKQQSSPVSGPNDGNKSPTIDYETQQRIAFVIPSTGGPNFQDEENEFDYDLANEITQKQIQIQGRLPPHFSALTAEEHELYLEYSRKIHREQLEKRQNPNAMPKLNPGERQLFTQLSITVKHEVAEYQKWFLADVQEHKDDYQKYPSSVQTIVENVIAEYKNRVLNYPRYYKTLVDYSVLLNSPKCHPTPTDPILKHSQTVHNAGVVPVWKSRITAENFPVSLPGASGLNIYPGARDMTEEETSKWCKLRLPDVSKDEIISDILRKAYSVPIDIVISSSTMQTLMDNIGPDFIEQWEIPVTIKSITRVDHTKRKFVILDKPLVKHKISLREKNTKYARYAVAHLSLQPKDKDIRVFPKAGGPGGLVEEKLHSTGHNLTYNTWSFGDLLLLVRCSIHGIIHNKDDTEKFRYIGVKAKMEYQLQRGFEVVSPSESIRWWIYTYLRPDTHLMVGRCNALTQELAKLEYFTMQDIHASSAFRPEVSSKLVYVLLKQLVSLPEGQYILSHKSGEAKVDILQAVCPPKPSQVDLSDEELTIIDEDDEDDNMNTKKDETKKEEEFSFSYDLYEQHADSGASDMDAIPSLMPKWTSETHIPYTFPIAPKGKTGKRKKPPKKPRARHCFSFLKYGSCKSATVCPYPHLTATQVQELSQQMKNSTKRRKSKRQRRNTHI